MPGVLTSWKEIGHYLGRGVRTAQRWERHFGLPVRRPASDSRRAILAIPEELDAWTRAQTKGPTGPVADTLRAEMTVLREELADIRGRLTSVETRMPAATTPAAGPELPKALDRLPLDPKKFR